MKYFAAVFFLSCCLSARSQTNDYGSGYIPEPPVAFPAFYKDYQILPGSISPNARYAFIYPKRSILYSLADYHLLFVTLKPFRVLSELPLGHSNLASNARCYYAVKWAENSSGIVFIAGGRWGPEKVSAILLRNNRISRQVELTGEIRQLVRTSYLASRAAPYNDYYEFVFEEDFEKPKWKIDDDGQVFVETTCSTDPKGIDPEGWTARFNGKWNLQKGRFEKQQIVRIPYRKEM